MAPRVLVSDPAASLEEVREVLAPAGAIVEVATRPFAGDDVVGLLVAFDEAVGGDDIARLPALRIVATTSIGYEHIEVEAASGQGIWVCNVPDYCVDEVADTTIAFLLALLRGIVALDRSVRAGGWSCTAAGPLQTSRGTRLGLIGFGRIGRAVAARAGALGFEVWAYDPLVTSEEIAAANVRPAAFEELLSSCQAFSLHVPVTVETERLLGEAEIALMPPGAIIVNTARGRLLDVDALLSGLESGHLAGAALDVLPVEPPTPDAPVPEAPNLIVTPHAAWYSLEAQRAETRGAALAICDVLEGKPPRNAVAEPTAPRPTSGRPSAIREGG